MFFKTDKTKNNNNDLAKVAALLIHAAKIDENYSINEENIIKKTILEIGVDEKYIDEILKIGKEIEENSNQILEFTKEVKNMNHEDKIKIIETLWRIVYSDKKVDIYESNLMRRLAGLLYIDSNTMGNIKDKIQKKI
tara:strand:- start:113 stop:523 length:411 start_codon:yes stop_codon:yes gene_type:complete